MHGDMFDVGLWVIWQTGSSTDCGEKISPPSVWTLRKTESMLGLDDPGYILASTSDASEHNSPPPHRLQMLLNNMSWEKCIRQRRGVTAIFRRHFPPGAPLGKEKKRRKKRAGRSYRRRERNHLLHKTSETSRTCSAAKRPAAIAELNWYWCALSSAQTWHVLSKYNVDEWAPGWVHVCYLPAVWRHVQQVFFGQNE